MADAEENSESGTTQTAEHAPPPTTGAAAANIPADQDPSPAPPPPSQTDGSPLPAGENAQAAEQPSPPQPSAPRHTIITRPVRTLTVAVTGATGFVGRAVCQRLIENGHRIRPLVRPGATPARRSGLPKSAQVVEGDLFDEAALARLVDKVDAVIHLVGIIREDPRRGITFEHIHVEGTQNIVNAANAAGILRYVHMSALGSRPGAPARYHATKAQAEQIVRASHLPYTIFKPSLIHGPNGEFTHMVSKWVRGKAPPFFFMPYFGSGLTGHGPLTYVQPVYINDLAEIFCRALDNEHTIRETYNLGGGAQLTWPEMLTTFRDAIHPGSRKKARPVPAWYALRLARVARFLSLGGILPFNVDQVLMSQENSTCELERVHQHFGLEPLPLAEALSQYARSL